MVNSVQVEACLSIYIREQLKMTSDVNLWPTWAHLCTDTTYKKRKTSFLLWCCVLTPSKWECGDKRILRILICRNNWAINRIIYQKKMTCFKNTCGMMSPPMQLRIIWSWSSSSHSSPVHAGFLTSGLKGMSFYILSPWPELDPWPVRQPTVLQHKFFSKY